MAAHLAAPPDLVAAAALDQAHLDPADSLKLKADDSTTPGVHVLPAGDEDGNLAMITQHHSGSRKTTTTLEKYSYYIWYIGNGGISPYNYGPTQFQNLIYQAGWDPAYPAGTTPCGDGDCVLRFGGSNKSVASIVLDISGISFAIQAVVFIFIGSYADYGNSRRWILNASTIASFAIGFAWLAVETPNKWGVAAFLNIAGYVTYQICNVFFIAAHVGLARDLPILQQSEEDVLNGKKTPAEHAELDMLERNRISNISYVWLSLAGGIICIIAYPILLALHTNDSTANNTKGYSVICAYATAIWVVVAIPWTWAEQSRPGKKMPPGSNYFTVGFKNMIHAFKKLPKLRQTAIYLLAFFILNDANTTAFTLVGIAQNDAISYDTVTFNWLTFLGYWFEGVGIWVLWGLQKRYNWHTRTLVIINGICLALGCLWGFIGIWAPVGYHKVPEFWVWQTYAALTISPWYQIGYTMIGDVVPPGTLNLFFALFGIVGRTSSFVGPFVTSAIIDDANGNTNMGFAFLLPFTLLGVALLFFVDIKKSKLECKLYLEEEARNLYKAGETELAQREAGANA